MSFFKKPGIILNVLLPTILGILMLYAYQQNKRKPAEIGLGKGTSLYMPYINDAPIHIGDISKINILKKGWQIRGEKELTLWFGNSQLHGINQYKPGQQNCVYYCYKHLDKIKQTMAGISFPNVNMQELLLAVMYLHYNFPSAKKMIIPFFYDDTREDGIRNEMITDSLKKWIKFDGEKKYTNDIPNIGAIYNMSIGKNNGQQANDMKALDKTAQESSEKYLDSIAQSNWGIWANRPDIRGNLFNDLYLMRNSVLGIKATTIRKIIPAKYETNYKAMQMILKFAKDKKIQLIIYIPPIRNDVAPPYEPEAYSLFKRDVMKDAKDKNAIFLNLENLVPAKYWGQKESTNGNSETELDFMHFQEAGHMLIADTIYKVLKSIKNDF